MSFQEEEDSSALSNPAAAVHAPTQVPHTEQRPISYCVLANLLSNLLPINMVSNSSAGDAAAPQAQPQPLSGSMNPGPVVDNKNTQAGSAPVASSGTPLPRTQESDFAVDGKNKEITHGADLTKETGKAFTQEKVDGAASGEKHLDSSLNKQQVPAGARELKEVSTHTCWGILIGYHMIRVCR